MKKVNLPITLYSDILNDEFDVIRHIKSIINDMFNNHETTLCNYSISKETSIPINIYEDDDNIYVEASIPGVDPNSIDITVQDNILKISGEKSKSVSKKSEKYHRQEHYYGKFSRHISIPDKIDTDNINAIYKNGILVIILPKLDSSKPKKISIKTE